MSVLILNPVFSWQGRDALEWVISKLNTELEELKSTREGLKPAMAAASTEE